MDKLYGSARDISMSLTVECTATVPCLICFCFCFCLFRRLDKFGDGGRRRKRRMPGGGTQIVAPFQCSKVLNENGAMTVWNECNADKICKERTLEYKTQRIAQTLNMATSEMKNGRAN